MRNSNKVLVSLAFLMLHTAACAEPETDLQQEIAPALDRPDAAAPALAADLTTVGQFRGTVNGQTGELTIDMLAPDQVTDQGLRRAAQGLCAMNIVQDGVAGSGPAESLELVTDNTGLDDACPAAAGAPAFCGDVTIRSFYTRPLAHLYAQIDTMVPSAGFSVANGDQVVGASSGLGSWAYPDLDAAGGSGDAATRTWLFNRAAGNFSFTGRVVANIPELCNGVDDDCDGIVDEGAQCRGLGAACTATADCAADLSCDAGLCRTQCGNGNLEALEQCDDGNAVTETCGYATGSCTVCNSLCQLVPGATSTCGDGLVHAPEESCDDGNLVTEACAYGQTSCTVCNPSCQPVAAATSFCGDGITDPAQEQCDDGNTVTDNCPYGDTICSVCDSNCQTASGIPQVCGDGIVNGAESCDDGNQTTETCAYGETACTICDATCASAAGAASFCGDGILAAGETCDDGNMVDGDSCSGLCTCGTGYHLEAGSCEADLRACAVANGTGLESWNGSAYSSCQATACDAAFHVAGLLCESDTRGCSVTGGSGSQQWNGTAFGACVATSCDSGHSLLAGSCVAVGCGNSVVEAGEACDDGNSVNTDGCTTVCTVAACGDGFVQGAESCDEGNTITEACAYGETSCTVCDATCASVAGATSFCGDGIVAATETCDDGNSVDGDSCNNSCLCGAGFHLEAGSCVADTRSCVVANGTGSESWNGAAYSACQATGCDATFHVAGLVCEADVQSCSLTGGIGTQQWNGTAFGACVATVCDSGYSLLADSCVAVGCGNSVVEAGEACDDGNAVNTDSCTSSCTIAACGDGFVQSGESCDEGNTVTEACAYGQTSCTVCDATCQSVAGAATFCGDSVVQGSEACDDGNSNDADGCATDCGCSVGFHLEAGLCTVDTRSCVLANGTGSQSWNGSAYGSCQVVTCDSGFHAASNLCEADTRSCTVTGGSGTQSWNGSAFAACVATSCSTGYSLLAGTCVEVGCGNSVVEAGEACDDGNSVNTDGCTSACALPACGDGFVQAGEGCDEGNTVTEACAYGQTSCTVCNATCQLAAGAATFCGDGVVQNGEVCDDGNSVDGDSCANNCACGTGYHLEAGLCTIDTRSCTTANGTGSQSWTGAAYGACTATSCNAGYTIVSGACVNSRSCTVANGSGTQSWSGSNWNACVASSCDATYHIEAGICAADSRTCSAGNGTGTQTWTSGAWGSCQLTACNSTFHFEAGLCVSDTRTCSVTNGSGTQLWNGTTYGACTATSCNATYHVEAGLCASDTRTCTVTGGTGTQSWSSGAWQACAATACTTGYHLETATCVENTRSCTVTNGTGTQLWTPSAAVEVSAGEFHSCSLMEDGSIRCWGDNTLGQTSVPSGANNFVDVSAGGTLSCGVRSNGTVACWGSNGQGQTSVTSGLNTATQVAAGDSHACALRANGTVTCWGANSSNQSNVSGSLNSVTQIDVGDFFSCARKSDGTVACWGSNSDNQRSVPSGLTGVTQISAGGTHACARKSDGTVVCWGNNGDGQRSVSSGLTGVTQVAAGGTHTCALKSDGTVVCWGDNADGQRTVPAGLTGVTQISAGAAHTCALKSDESVVCWGNNADGEATPPVGVAPAAWAACTMTACNTGFHAESGACVSDTRSCTVTGGSGTQTWNGSSYSACVASSCTAGYTLVSGSCTRAGNVLVERIGDGSNNLNSDGMPVALVEYGPDGGSSLFTTTSFNTGTNRLVDAGTTTSAGYFNIANGLIALSGYDDSVGTSNSNLLNNNNKAVNFLGADLTVSSRVEFPSSGVMQDEALRSVVPGPSGTFYAVSNGTGVWYYTGSVWRRVTTTSSTSRAVDIFGGNLYYSTASGNAGVYQVGTGLPSSTGTTATRIMTVANPTAFVLLDCDGNSTLERAYVADESTGLIRFDLSGSTWNNTYAKFIGNSGNTNLVSSGGQSIRGLTGSCSAGTATLYATTSETTNNRLVKVVDSSTNGTTGAPTTYTQLAASGSRYIFRGVEVRPF